MLNISVKLEESLKGTGTRDYNWLQVVWHDGSWLGESPADIQKIFNRHINFILN